MKRIITLLILVVSLSGCDVAEEETLNCDEGYEIVNEACSLIEETVTCDEGYEFIEDTCEHVLQDDYEELKVEFLTLLTNFEDILAFSGKLTIEEENNIVIKNEEDLLLQDSYIYTSMKYDFINGRIDVLSTNSLDDIVYHSQLFEANYKVVNIVAFNSEIYIEHLNYLSLWDYLFSSELVADEDTIDSDILSIEKLDEYTYIIEYDKSIIYDEEFINGFFGETSFLDDSEIENVFLTYTFSEDSKSYNLEYTLGKLILDNVYFVTLGYIQEFEIVDELYIELIKSGDVTIPGAKTIDEIYFIFEEGDPVYFDQTTGDNYIAFDLEAGYYSVFNSDRSSIIFNPYMKIYDENLNEILTDGYLYLENDSRIYLNFEALGDWTNPRYFMFIDSVEVLSIDAGSYEEMNGLFTTNVSSDEKTYIAFNPVDESGFLLLEITSMHSDNYLILEGDTRCDNTELGEICAIKIYGDKDITISIQGLINDEVTINYSVHLYDDISMDINNPILLSNISDGIAFDYDEYTYIQFEVYESGIYSFNTKLLQTGYYINSSFILYDSSGNMINPNWETESLEPGSYIVKVSIEGFYTAVMPELIKEN